MVYATAQALRLQYLTGDTDEFSHLSDGVLDRHLARASATIDRYRPAVTLTQAVLDLLAQVCMAIARPYAHDEHALSEDHPARRDYDEALRWLMLWSEGAVNPIDASATSISAPTRTMLYGDEFLERYTLP